jgi:hypothetical protein
MANMLTKKSSLFISGEAASHIKFTEATSMIPSLVAHDLINLACAQPAIV